MDFEVDGTLWTDRDEQGREAFAQVVGDCEATSLARLALQVATGEYQELLVQGVLAKLADTAQEIRAGLPGDATAAEKIAAVNMQLYDIGCLFGDSAEFYDPRSCYLNDVLSRRLGVPVSLIIIWSELAERIGLDMDVVSLPGHLLLRRRGGTLGAAEFIDPSQRGAILDRADCEALLKRFSRGRMPWSDEYLQPVARRFVLTLHLNDLKAAYRRLGDDRRVLRWQNYLLTLHPGSPELHRDRGLLLLDLRATGQARRELQVYLRLAPAASDRESIDALLAQLS